MAVKNYKMIIRYDGTRYYGWEHQPDKDTVQGRIEAVLSHLDPEGDTVEVTGAGRTDGGVHAEGMCANFRLDTRLDEEELLGYLNRYLPDDIAVINLREASDRFHARYNATGKTYRYTIYNGPLKPVFDRKYVWTIEERLDIEKMRAAAAELMGRHDFAAFCKAAAKNKSTVRNVDRIEISSSKGYIYISFHGDGFLRNMVRIMTGTIVSAGKDEISAEEVRRLLEGRDRKALPPTAPAQGLCLVKVDYD